MTISPVFHICQFIGFIAAVFSNSLLLYLIRKRAGTSFGRYRVMMITFSIYAIVYATVEVLTLPVLQLYGAGLFCYVNSFLKDYYSAGIFIQTMYCGSFALCIALLATQFIYRYIAVCKHQKLYLFEGSKLYLWLIPPIFLFTAWAASIYINCKPSQLKRDYFRNMTMEYYGENIDEISFVATLYFTCLPDGTRLFSPQDLFGVALNCSIINLCFGTCLVCACKTYKKLNDASIRMSSLTRSLNKQLFWTLGLQTLLPCITQYTPVALIFLLPLFEVNSESLGNLTGVSCSLYPALDPFIAIFMIDKFRRYIFGKETSSITKNSQTAPTFFDVASGTVQMKSRRTAPTS